MLDPIFSLRRRVRARGRRHRARRRSRRWSRRRARRSLDLADKYRDPATFERAATLAWTQAQVQLHHLGIEPDEAHLFQRLASRVLYADPALRAVARRARAQHAAASRALWAHGISGDLPIVLVRIDEAEDQEIVRQLLRAHEYWRMKQLAVDLVILNEQPALVRAGSAERRSRRWCARASRDAPPEDSAARRRLRAARAT